MPSASLNNLPYDVLRHVESYFDEVEDRMSLLSLRLVCRNFQDIFTKKAFRCMKIASSFEHTGDLAYNLSKNRKVAELIEHLVITPMSLLPEDIIDDSASGKPIKERPFDISGRNFSAEELEQVVMLTPEKVSETSIPYMSDLIKIVGSCPKLSKVTLDVGFSPSILDQCKYGWEYQPVQEIFMKATSFTLFNFSPKGLRTLNLQAGSFGAEFTSTFWLLPTNSSTPLRETIDALPQHLRSNLSRWGYYQKAGYLEDLTELNLLSNGKNDFMDGCEPGFFSNICKAMLVHTKSLLKLNISIGSLCRNFQYNSQEFTVPHASVLQELTLKGIRPWPESMLKFLKDLKTLKKLDLELLILYSKYHNGSCGSNYDWGDASMDHACWKQMFEQIRRLKVTDIRLAYLTYTYLRDDHMPEVHLTGDIPLISEYEDDYHSFIEMLKTIKRRRKAMKLEDCSWIKRVMDEEILKRPFIKEPGLRYYEHYGIRDGKNVESTVLMLNP